MTRATVDQVVAAVIQRVKNGTRPAVEESRFVFGDEAYVKVTLRDTSAEAIDRLEKAGFVIMKREGSVITGHVPLANLEAVSKLPFITWMTPR